MTMKTARGGQEIAARAHRGCRKRVADGGEAGVAPKPVADGPVPDKAEADRGNCRAEHAACGRMSDGGAKHDRKNRIDGIGERAQADHGDGNAGDQPFGLGCIHQRSARHLRDQRDESGRGENKTDVDLRPFLRRQINRDERPETRLHVGDEEDEPIEPAQGARGGRGWRFAFSQRPVQRRRGLVRRRSLVTGPVVRAA